LDVNRLRLDNSVYLKLIIGKLRTCGMPIKKSAAVSVRES